jgi:hypothetical protein
MDCPSEVYSPINRLGMAKPVKKKSGYWTLSARL